MGQIGTGMPKYKCHNVVQALEIQSVDLIEDADAGAVIMPADEGYPSFQVSFDYVVKHDPQPGGYYVLYDAGYESYSPKEPFEAGYTLIEPESSPENTG